MKRKIFIICALFAAFQSPAQMVSPRNKAVADKIIATVGDEVILSSDIQNSVERFTRENPSQASNAYCLIAEQAIRNKLLVSQALHDSISVEGEVEAELDRRIGYYINQLGSKQKLEEYAGKTVYQIKDDARESVKEEKLAEAMQQKITGTMTVTPAEVKSYFDRIPKDSLPLIGSEVEVAQIVSFPGTEMSINQAKAKLDTVRSRIIAGSLGFNEAASKYSDDESAKFTGPFILNHDGSPYIAIDQLDQEMMTTVNKMKVGEISAPVAFTGDQNKKAARIVFLKSRSEPHRMNLRQDYSKISQMALEQKRDQALDKWLMAKVPTYYIKVDTETATSCPKVQKYASDTKRF